MTNGGEGVNYMRRSVSKIIYINVILFFLVYMAFFNDLSRVINIDNLLKSSFSQYCTFAVPSFFMLSGSFFVKINYKKILPNSIKNRIGLENVSQDKMNKERSDNKILIPIFAFLIFGLTITKLLNYKQFTLTYSFKMNNILATGVNYFGGTLITLIVILLILKIFSKLKILKETESEGKNSIKPLLYVFAVLVVLFILSFLLIKYLTNNNYISYFYYTLYFVIGALLTLLALYGKMDEDLEEFINKIAIVFIIISILIILYNPAITSLHNIYGNLYLIDESSIYYFFSNVLLFMGIMLLDETEITVKDFYYINIFYTLYLLISFLVFKHFIGIDSLTRKSSFLTNTNILLISLLFFMISSLLTHLIIFIWNSVTERRKCIDNHPNKNDHKDFTMYDDQPIREESDDRLSRKIMAKKLSEVICNIHFNSSFAIGVSGEWGSGKTSILNMVKNNLDSDIVAVELDPWDTIDNNQLMNNFFSSIIEKLEENEDGSFKQIIREMKQYCYYLNNLSEVIPSTIFKVIRTISFISNYQNQSLKKKKDRLAKKLKNTNKKILVIIDDIDRLSDDRIPFIFQLIASIAKFPNIIYLLAYDKKVVTNALDNLQKDCGEMYLDKCIQLSIDIPNASKDHLNEILQHKITDQNRILNIKEDNSKYENFFDFIMQYIDSVRKINKFINTYTYYCFLLEQEIYYQDILRIVAIQLFQPSLYVCILAHENIFHLAVRNIMSYPRSITMLIIVKIINPSRKRM